MKGGACEMANTNVFWIRKDRYHLVAYRSIGRLAFISHTYFSFCSFSTITFFAFYSTFCCLNAPAITALSLIPSFHHRGRF
jgi:hypothetical protein